MSDIKSDLRDAEADAKEAWRKVDGESVSDKVADAGDRVGNAVKDAGDKLHEAADEASRKVSSERVWVDTETERVDDTGA